MKKIITILVVLLVNNVFGKVDYVISIYTPLAGISTYSNESSSIDEDDSSISANEISYLFKVNYLLSDSFSVGIESASNKC